MKLLKFLLWVFGVAAAEKKEAARTIEPCPMGYTRGVAIVLSCPSMCSCDSVTCSIVSCSGEGDVPGPGLVVDVDFGTGWGPNVQFDLLHKGRHTPTIVTEFESESLRRERKRRERDSWLDESREPLDEEEREPQHKQRREPSNKRRREPQLDQSRDLSDEGERRPQRKRGREPSHKQRQKLQSVESEASPEELPFKRKRQPNIRRDPESKEREPRRKRRREPLFDKREGSYETSLLKGKLKKLFERYPEREMKSEREPQRKRGREPSFDRRRNPRFRLPNKQERKAMFAKDTKPEVHKKQDHKRKPGRESLFGRKRDED